ncbi:hypothetical protein V6N11_079849 [Hibiscus sabdariffa]|uniref:Uncharacterized protein n=2 Tax=Hibiscus sabdariffa TaxID=183260 RepID=A0ABR2RWL9_9ROSI
MLPLFLSTLFQIKTMLRGAERAVIFDRCVYQSRSTLPAKSLVNWVVSEKQRPNGRFDKALPWKDKATDHELKEFINESLKKMHKADASTSTIAKGIPH